MGNFPTNEWQVTCRENVVESEGMQISEAKGYRYEDHEPFMLGSKHACSCSYVLVAARMRTLRKAPTSLHSPYSCRNTVDVVFGRPMGLRVRHERYLPCGRSIDTCPKRNKMFIKRAASLPGHCGAMT